MNPRIYNTEGSINGIWHHTHNFYSWTLCNSFPVLNFKNFISDGVSVVYIVLNFEIEFKKNWSLIRNFFFYYVFRIIAKIFCREAVRYFYSQSL